MALPIDEVLPQLVGVLDAEGRAVLQAPPGAGKTTGVPLALLEAGSQGRIIMLEPRRLAARAAAERMAEVLGEPCGQTVGYRIRGEAKVSSDTRIEVVTEGILTRMLQDAPDLPGIGTVIFDEFHERSLNADLGLALAWEARGALRPDLRILVMSATLDADPVAAMLDGAPLISSEGRAYPVETRWLERALGPTTRWDRAMSDLIVESMDAAEGSCLAFLPGEGEIRRVANLVADRLPDDVQVRPLYGALPFRDQRAAIRPEPAGRKLVLSTSIAETSLTIEDVRIVVDGGKARRARFDAAKGMSRLVTEDVSRAEADQRRGRAGRVAPGVCYRLWTRGQEGARPAFPPAEIEVADLTGLALELAQWGGADGLSFLTQPPEKAMEEARELLKALGALDAEGRITRHGRYLVRLPLHPRLGHLLRTGGPGSSRLAALLGERDPMRRADVGVDQIPRLRALTDRDGRADPAAIARIREEAKRLQRHESGEPLSPGAQASLAYPDRIGLRRKGDAPRYLLSGGSGAIIPEGDPMVQARLIVATDLDGDRREGRIRGALSLTEAELRSVHGDRIVWQDTCEWSTRMNRVEARRQERLDAIILDDRRWDDPPVEAVTKALCDGIRALGPEALGWNRSSRLLRARVRYSGVADMSDTALLVALEEWAVPFVDGIRDAAGLGRFDPGEALRAWIGWQGMVDVDRLAPQHWTSPLGRKLAIDYSGDTPEISVRLQEVLGTTTHPTVGIDRLPIRMVLLSPASRPIQVTTDLPGFWAGSYADVRKDMRAQYPKHLWPEDPTTADPTLRAKPQKD